MNFFAAGVCLNESKMPFFANQKGAKKEEAESIEEQARREAQEELAKTKRMSNLRNANG